MGVCVLSPLFFIHIQETLYRDSLEAAIIMQMT